MKRMENIHNDIYRFRVRFQGLGFRVRVRKECI